MTVNTQFDKNKPLDFKDSDLIIESDCKSNQDDGRKWSITLKATHQPPAGANSPYFFSLVLVGLFHVNKDYDEPKVERLAKTNGPSVLYGILREMIRDITSRGPYFPIMLPTASFYESKPSSQPEVQKVKKR